MQITLDKLYELVGPELARLRILEWQINEERQYSEQLRGENAALRIRVDELEAAQAAPPAEE